MGSLGCNCVANVCKTQKRGVHSQHMRFRAPIEFGMVERSCALCLSCISLRLICLPHKIKLAPQCSPIIVSHQAPGAEPRQLIAPRAACLQQLGYFLVLLSIIFISLQSPVCNAMCFTCPLYHIMKYFSSRAAASQLMTCQALPSPPHLPHRIR